MISPHAAFLAAVAASRTPPPAAPVKPALVVVDVFGRTVAVWTGPVTK